MDAKKGIHPFRISFFCRDTEEDRKFLKIDKVIPLTTDEDRIEYIQNCMHCSREEAVRQIDSIIEGTVTGYAVAHDDQLGGDYDVFFHNGTRLETEYDEEEDMGRQGKELTAYCGLFCGDCIRYKSKASDLALQLLNELSKIKFENYVKIKQSSVKELKSYEEMISALEAICKLKCDIPCRSGGDGCAQPCEIAKCVHLKGIEGCWECTEFEACDNFEFLRPFHGNAPQNNIKKIKKYGLDKWDAHREGMYTWSERTSEDKFI